MNREIADDESETEITLVDIATGICELMDSLQIDSSISDETIRQFCEDSLPFVVKAVKYYCGMLITESEKEKLYNEKKQ